MRSKEQMRQDLRREVEEIQSKIQATQSKTETKCDTLREVLRTKAERTECDIKSLTRDTERRIEQWLRDIAIKENQLRDLVERPRPPQVCEEGPKSCDLCCEDITRSAVQMYHEEMQDWVTVCKKCHESMTGQDMPSPFRGEKTFVRVSGRWVCCD
jgi:hypothetical protein